MKKYFILLFLLCLKAFARVDSSETIYNNLDRFLYFMPASNNIIGLCWEDKFEQQSVKIWSKKDGDLIKEVLLERDEDVKAFNVSHDDSSFIIMSRSIDEDGKNAYIIKKYLIQENRWAWRKIWYKTASLAWLKSWYSKAPCLRLVYSDDNKQIICVTYLHTLILNSEDGEIINKSNKITSELKYGDYVGTKMDLSRTGRYFVFWNQSNWAGGEYGSGLFGNIIDGTSNAIGKTIFGFTNKYITVWDVLNDCVEFKIQIPKKTSIGAPAISVDETKFIFGTLRGSYYEYSITEKKLSRQWKPNSLIISNQDFEVKYDWSGSKVISPDNKYFASYHYPVANVRNNDSGLPIMIWTSSATGGYSHYQPFPMAFSSDSKYFALEHDGKIRLYSTTDWEMIWSKQTY